MRKILSFLSAFIAVGAFWGALMFFMDPSGARWGMAPLLVVMQEHLPFVDLFFRDLFWSGIALALGIGLTNSLAWFSLLKRKPYALNAQILCGILLLAWLGVQWVIFALNPLTILYTFFALLQLFLGIRLKKV